MVIIKIGIRIELAILNVLSNQVNPISTRELAIKINRSWHSVQYHCLRLQMQGKVIGYRISNINVWLIKLDKEVVNEI